MRTPTLAAAAAAGLASSACCVSSAAYEAPPLYKTPGAPIDDRVADLVSRMNLQEKVNQLALPFEAKFPGDYQEFNVSGLGATYPLAALPGEHWYETRNNWQRNAVQNTRLGIPTSFIAETPTRLTAGAPTFPCRR
jgi:beta-glucosidase